MSAAIVDGNSRRWKVRVGKRTYRDAHRFLVSVLGVEDGGSANRAEPEDEPCSLIADTNVFLGGTEDLERSGEAR
jgi:hypothetical protein